MSKTVECPGAEIPAPPHVAMDVPDDWGVLVVPGVQIAVAEPRVEGRFRCNVVVTVQRFAPGFDIERAREGMDTRKAGLPDLEDLGTGDLVQGDRTWVASEYGYTQPGAATVVQAARYTVIDRGEAGVDVIEVVGSCGADQADTQIEIVRDIQDSVRIRVD